MAERMWIKNRLAELGMRQADLARRLGITDVKVTKMINGTRAVQPREWRPLADALQLPVEEVSKLLGAPLFSADSAHRQSTETIDPNHRRQPEVVYPSSTPKGIVRDLPVYGAAEGGDGVMILDNEPVEYMDRPPELIGVKDGFAVYVRGDSMAPAFEPGDRIHINPNRQVAPGRDTLFESVAQDGTRHGTIKRLVKITPKAWRVLQYNPERTFDLPRAKWQKAYRIVGKTMAD